MPKPSSGIPSREASRQRLRLRRFLLASTFSLLYLLVLAVFFTQDKLDRDTLAEACAIVAALILGLLGVFRFGLNLRFPDPSLTAFQLLAAVGTMLFVVYRAPDTRLVFAAFFSLP
jgi:diguanylate cyclase